MADGKIEIDTEIDTSKVDKGLEELKQKLLKAANGANKLDESLDDVSDTAEETADAVEETAEQIEEMGDAVEETTKKSKKASDASASFSDQLKEVFKKGGTVATVMGTVAKATQKAAEIIRETSDAYKVQINAENALATAAENNPMINSEAVDNLKAFASEMQGVSNLGDEFIIGFESQLVAAGRTEEEIKKIIKVAADVSATGAMSFESAVSNLNKTFAGLAGELGETIPELKNLTAEELQAGAAVDLLGEKYKGMANELVDAKTQAQNAKGDFAEAIGALTAPAASAWDNFWKSFYEKGTLFINKINDRLELLNIDNKKLLKDLDELAYKYNEAGQSGLSIQNTEALMQGKRLLEIKEDTGKITADEKQLLIYINGEIAKRQGAEQQRIEQEQKQLELEQNQFKQKQKILSDDEKAASIINDVNFNLSQRLAMLETEAEIKGKTVSEQDKYNTIYSAYLELLRRGTIQENGATKVLISKNNQAVKSMKERLDAQKILAEAEKEAEEAEIEAAKAEADAIAAAEAEKKAAAEAEKKAAAATIAAGKEVLKNAKETAEEAARIAENKLKNIQKEIDAKKAIIINLENEYEFLKKNAALHGEQVKKQDVLNLLLNVYKTIVKDTTGFLNDNGAAAATLWKQIEKLNKEIQEETVAEKARQDIIAKTTATTKMAAEAAQNRAEKLQKEAEALQNLNNKEAAGALAKLKNTTQKAAQFAQNKAKLLQIETEKEAEAERKAAEKAAEQQKKNFDIVYQARKEQKEKNVEETKNLLEQIEELTADELSEEESLEKQFSDLKKDINKNEILSEQNKAIQIAKLDEKLAEKKQEIRNRDASETLKKLQEITEEAAELARRNAERLQEEERKAAEKAAERQKKNFDIVYQAEKEQKLKNVEETKNILEQVEELTADELSKEESLEKQFSDLKKQINENEILDERNKNQAIAMLDEELNEKRQKLREEEEKKEKEKREHILEEVKNYSDEWLNIVDKVGKLAAEHSEINNETELKNLEIKYQKGEIGEEEYAQKKKEIREKAARDEYAANMTSWTASLLTATANIAQGVTKAIAQGGVAGIATGALVSAAGAVQLASIIGSKPTPPKFAEGGIVEGTSYSGDNIAARVNSGEMVLTMAQQRALFDVANGRGSMGAPNITINNSASNLVKATPSISQDRINIMIDARVNESLQAGKYDTSLTMAQQGMQGKFYGI